MEYQNRLGHPRFKSPYFGAKYQQRDYKIGKTYSF